MIRVFKTKKIIIQQDGSAHEYEYSCPHCFKPVKWDFGRLSPMHCPGCKGSLPELSKVIKESDWRLAYHKNGMKGVPCNGSPLI
jgi:hypothetical protein